MMSTYDNYVRLDKIEIPKLDTEMTSAASKLADANRGIDQVFNFLHLAYPSAPQLSVR
jgi:hypothetical protein